jgi:hypothetical protein
MAQVYRHHFEHSRFFPVTRIRGLVTRIAFLNRRAFRRPI